MHARLRVLVGSLEHRVARWKYAYCRRWREEQRYWSQELIRMVWGTVLSNVTSESPEDLLNRRVSDSVGVGWNLRI